MLRSTTPEPVRQEFWGPLLAQVAVRGLMHEAALKANEDPDRLSFWHAVRVVRRKVPLFAALSPRARLALHDAVLEERVVSGRGRQVPRGIKRKMSGYPLRLRAPWPTTQSDFTAVIRIVN